MSTIPGTNVAAPLAPFTTADTYPTHQAAFGKGGWRSAATIAERNAIPADRLEDGCVVYVQADGSTWQRRGAGWEAFSGGSSGGASSPLVRSVTEFGAVGDGVSDDTQAFIDAAEAVRAHGGGTIFVPFPPVRYRIAGETFSYGDFTYHDGSTTPFRRGIIPIYSNTSWIGEGLAPIQMSGGRTEPGGLFYHKFWEATGPLTNVRFSGLDLDGNLENQIITPYPANVPDNNVWQHGHAITVGTAALGTTNIEVDHCRIHGWRGNGVSVFSPEGPDPQYPTRSVKIHHNEFFNLFGIGCGATGIDYDIYSNWFHGDGYWIAAIDVETGLASTYNSRGRIRHNLFDFSDGLSPTERTPGLPSDSAEAQSYRRHLRRAVSFGQYYSGYPDRVYNGRKEDHIVSDNVILQGTMDNGRLNAITVRNNTFRNFYEDLSYVDVDGKTQQQPYAPTTVIGMNAYGTTGLGDIIVADNIIHSDLDGYGIILSFFENCHVAGNKVYETRWSGIRLEASSGVISDNLLQDCGAYDASSESGNAPFVTYGGQTKPTIISRNIIIDARSTSLTRYGFYLNTGVSSVTVADSNIVAGATLGIIEDVNNAVVSIGNSDGTYANRKYAVNVPISTTGLTSTGSISTATDLNAKQLILNGTTGDKRQVIFETDGHLYYTMALGDNGDFALNLFDPATGLTKENAFAIKQDGTVLLAGGTMQLSPTSAPMLLDLPTFADNDSAKAGGLASGQIYYTATGALMVVF
jgi:parallel beta-helix repeat protein